VKRPVRVLHLVAQLGGGGAERWVWDLVRLSDPSILQHRVFPLMLDRGDFVYADRLADARAYRHSVWLPLLRRLNVATEAVSAANPRRQWLASAWRNACYLRASVVLPGVMMAFRPDVIHAHTFEPLIAGLRLRGVFRKPLMHTVPALFSQMEDIGRSWLSDLYAKRHADIDVFFTGASRSELQSVGVPDEKILWSDAGIDIAAIEKALAQRTEHRISVRQEIGVDANAPIALSVGRFHPSKGHRYAIDAVSKLLQKHPDVHWVVLGIGQELSANQEYARSLGIGQHTHFLGFRDDPLPYYAAADLYFRTPVYEAENLCSYQAMAAGLPVIGFDTGVDTELLRSAGHGLLVQNRNADALAEAASEILLRPDRGAAIGRRGAEYARQHLDIRKSISELTDVYLSLAASAKASSSVPARDLT